MTQLRAADFPPVVLINDCWASPEFLRAVFGPAKYVEEFYDNPMIDCLAENYRTEAEAPIGPLGQEGSVIFLTAKRP